MTNGEMLNELAEIAQDRRRQGTTREEFRLALACIKETRGDVEVLKTTMTEQFQRVGDTLDRINDNIRSIDNKMQIISDKVVKYDAIVEQAKANPMLRLGKWMQEKPKQFSLVSGLLLIGGAIASTVWMNPSVRMVVFEWLNFPDSLITFLMP